MRIPGFKRARLLYRWLRSRLAGRALILGYHRIAQTEHDPYGVCVRPDHFAEQLALLAQVAQPVSLHTILEGLQQQNLPRRAVVVTFDDGYADTLYQAKPLLEQYLIPATVFVTTGYPGRQFWWDELESILVRAGGLPGQVDQVLSKILATVTEKETPASGQHLLWLLYERLLPLPAVERERIMSQLRTCVGKKTVDEPDRRALTADELIELAAGELVTLGAHTVTHPVLAALPKEEQEAEIRQSKSYLENLLGQRITDFSYPNGSINVITLELVREISFRSACASHNDVVWQGSNCFQLPRFWIPDWDGVRFSRWLRYWLPG